MGAEPRNRSAAGSKDVAASRTPTATPAAALGAVGLAGAGRGGAAGGRGGRGAAGGGHMDGMIGSVPPSPELLAKVAELPPIKDEPKVDLARARAADHHFTLRRLLAPIALALIAGLVLDGLNTGASLALPALVRGGTLGRGGEIVSRGRRARPGGARGRLRRLGGQRRGDHGGRAQRRAAAFHAAGQAVRAAAAARARLLRARAQRPDHDQDDQRRGRAFHVPADRARDDGELAADLRRCARGDAGDQRAARAARAGDRAGARGGDRGVPQEVVAGLHRGPGADLGGQRGPGGERGRAAGHPGVPPRGHQQAPGSRGVPSPTGSRGCGRSGTSRCTSRSCRRCPRWPPRWCAAPR